MPKTSRPYRRFSLTLKQNIHIFADSMGPHRCERSSPIRTLFLISLGEIQSHLHSSSFPEYVDQVLALSTQPRCEPLIKMDSDYLVEITLARANK